MSHAHAVTVHYEDTDLSGVVYHANYLKFIERARSAWVRTLGIDQNALRAQGLAFAVRSLTAEFHAPARLDDALRVTTEVRRITGARAILFQTVFRGDDPLFSAEVTLALFDMATGAVRRLPDGLRRAAT